MESNVQPGAFVGKLRMEDWYAVLYALDCFAVGACGVPDERLPQDRALAIGLRIRDQLSSEPGSAIAPTERNPEGRSLES